MTKRRANGHVGNLELITFRVTRYDYEYIKPISAYLSNLSVGHVALRLNFNSPALYNKYIKGHPNIPHTVNDDECEVYFSFWPDVNGRWSERGVLRSYLFDCEQSASYSPMEYEYKHLQPIERTTFWGTVTLPPTIILHTSRLGVAFGTLQNPNRKIMQAAENFALMYRAWREQIIHAEYEPDNPLQQQKIIDLLAILNESSYRLKSFMYPAQKMTNAEFMQKLKPFVTIGYPERDCLTLPVVENGTYAGLYLEPMLAFIRDLADHPEQHPYNVLDTNCALKTLHILWLGGKDSPHIDMQNEFMLPWYVRWGATLTPTFVIQLGARIQQICARLNSTIKEPEPESDIPSRFLSFSHALDRNRLDEAPSTSLAICDEMFNNSVPIRSLHS